MPVERGDDILANYESPPRAGAFRVAGKAIAVDSDAAAQNPVCIGFDLPLGLDTVEKANAWLQQQSAAGTPVEIAYPCVQPVEYQFPARELYTVRGENTFSADAGTLAVEYYGDPIILFDKIKKALAELGKNI